MYVNAHSHVIRHKTVLCRPIEPSFLMPMIKAILRAFKYVILRASYLTFNNIAGIII